MSSSVRRARDAYRKRTSFESLEQRNLLAADVTLFADSFEFGANNNDWVGNWDEDAQSDWYRSTQRATDGIRSAEVDGPADDATLTLANTIDLSSYTSGELSFDWLIESRFDSGEYLSLDISSDGGATWQTDVRRLSGNVDAENTWHSETVDLTPYASANLVVRFRAKANQSNEDANVDNLRITATPIVATEPLAEFIPLGFLAGQSESGARAISADGRFVVGNSGNEAFRWSREAGMISLGEFTARDVSADGEVVVGGVLDVSAFRWEDGTLTAIGDLTTIGRAVDDPGGTVMDDANGVSADGSVVVGNTGFDFKGEADSFRIVDSVIQPIGDLTGGAHASGVNAVSADGSIVAGQGDSGQGGTEAFLWEAGAFTPLGDLPGGTFESRVWTMSKNGQFVVGHSDSDAGREAYLWSSETGMIGLGHLPGETTDSRARGVTSDGSIVVGTANHGQSFELRDAFIWDNANGMRNLQSVLIAEYGLGEALQGWALTSAGISDDGSTLVGSGVNPSGLAEAFVVILDDDDTASQPPVADDDAYNVAEDGVLAIAAPGVLTNDTDPENDPLTAVLAADPAHGDVSLSADGSFTYTPDPDFFGVDSFTYRANDGTSSSAAATVNITVSPVNDAPVAAAQSVVTEQDAPIDIVLNGSDVDGDPLTFEIVDGPSSGDLSGTAPNLTYEPFAGFTGPDSFTFLVNDGTVDSSVVTVSISVTEVNHPPVAEDLAVVTDEDAPVAVTLSGSDSNDDALSYEILNGPAHGSLIGDAPNLTYTPTANYSGADSITYRVSDGTDYSTPAIVSIEVAAVNDAPVAADASYSVDQDATLTVPGPGVLANDSDIDGDSLTAQLVAAPTNGELSLSDDGSFVYTPDAGYSGTDTFSYAATDGSLSDAATVSIDVMPASANALFVYDIRFESIWGGWYRRAVFEIRSDSDFDGVGSAADDAAAGVAIEVEFAGRTYSGTTDSSGLFYSSWLRGTGSGTVAEVTDLALADFEWTPLDLDLEDDSDGNFLPDAVV